MAKKAKSVKKADAKKKKAVKVKPEKVANPLKDLTYPTMLYKAKKHESGEMMVGHLSDQAFAESTQLTVNSEDEAKAALAEGWSTHPDDALANAKE